MKSLVTAGTRLTFFRKVSFGYYVGLTGVFADNANQSEVLSSLFKKMMQVKQYCGKHNKQVFVLADETVPDYATKMVQALRISVTSIRKQASTSALPYFQDDNPTQFILANANVVLAFSQEGSDYELDAEDTPILRYTYTLLEKQPTTVTNPEETVRLSPEPKAPENDSPYYAFQHEDLFTRVPYNYWEQLMNEYPTNDAATTGPTGGQAVPTNVW